VHVADLTVTDDAAITKWMALIGLITAWGTGAAWAAEQAIDSRMLGLLARLDVPQLGAPNPGTNTGPALRLAHRSETRRLTFDAGQRHA
jgi:hypothetical protein